jgi:hypothetical protein
LCALAVKQRNACEKGRWKFSLGGRGKAIVLHDKVVKIITWLDKFKQVGDIVVQYDPHHFALPWAGVRFLLEVCYIDFHDLALHHSPSWPEVRLRKAKRL